MEDGHQAKAPQALLALACVVVGASLLAAACFGWRIGAGLFACALMALGFFGLHHAGKSAEGK